MPWDVFLFKGTMDLQVVQGRQTTVGYVETLQRASLMTEGFVYVVMIVFFNKTILQFICLTKGFFQVNTLTFLDYPACSSDLHPIENSWEWMEK